MTTADFDSAKKGPVEGPVEGLEELDLLAFRYIAEELSDDERGAFELRLADDQGAREAVARAVELSQASLAALEMMEQELPEPIGVAPREVSGWYTRILWMTSGAVACLVGLVGYQFATSPAQLPVNPGVSGEVARLADAWTDAQESLRAAADLAPAAIPSEETSSEAFPSDIPADSITDMGDTPSWVLAAVGVEEDESGDGAEKPLVPGGVDQ